MVSDLIRSVESKIEITPTQKLAAFVNSEFALEQFDLVSFCESRGIDMSNLWKVSRLYQIGESSLADFWNSCLQNNPSLLEQYKDPSELYRGVIDYKEEIGIGSLRFLETIGFSSTEVEKLEHSMTASVAEKLQDCKKLVKSNIEYLEEIKVKNIHEIFNEYYELFLMDYSNFTGIFNKYDPEDLVEKLEKNIAIIEYL